MDGSAANDEYPSTIVAYTTGSEVACRVTDILSVFGNAPLFFSLPQGGIYRFTVRFLQLESQLPRRASDGPIELAGSDVTM